MTLIPLNNINFVKSTVKVSPKTTYVSASSDCNNFSELSIDSPGISGLVYDRNNFSKSIIPTKVDNPIENSNLNFITKSIMKHGFKEGIDLIDRLDRVKNNDTLLEINANNFKNSFKIDRNVQNFLYGDVVLDRKNYIKNIVYPFYRHNKNNDNLNNINWGFSNYNSLNFFSQSFSSNNTKHTNCLAYPNLYTPNSSNSDGSYQYDFIGQNSFNISFFINKRSTGSITNDQCIIHIPRVLSVFIVDGSETDIFEDINQYKIKIECYRTEISGNENDKKLSFESSNCIISNNWNYVSINFNKRDNNKYDIVCYVDNNIVMSSSIDDTDFTKHSKSFDSCILIGNKFNH